MECSTDRAGGAAFPVVEDVSFGEVDLRLLSHRGAYWQLHDLLLVADLHLGKEATFRRHGIAVPRGSTDATLATLSEMLLATGATKLIVLGDLFHARSSLREDVLASVDGFLDRHPELSIGLVRGNHDKHVGSLSPRLGRIEELGDEARFGSVQLTHHPGEPDAGSTLRLAGHLHPAVRVDPIHGLPNRLSCFWWSRGCLVLPAAGQFTGTACVRPDSNDRVWIIAGDAVVPFNARGQRQSSKRRRRPGRG